MVRARRDYVSTHSRPKAAGACSYTSAFSVWCFNTQPPEGGWIAILKAVLAKAEFQHTAARRRLGRRSFRFRAKSCFNTQPPEGGWVEDQQAVKRYGLFQHTAARRRLAERRMYRLRLGSFNTQPPEGGWHPCGQESYTRGCFNTQPPEGGWEPQSRHHLICTWFQHTAARRRLGRWHAALRSAYKVSTHSRPKAAGACNWPYLKVAPRVSTHSRPKAAGYRLSR